MEETRRRLQRLVFRCVADYLMDRLRALILTHDGNFTRGIIALAITQATRGRDARPISVRAVSESLGMPYETTRRQVRELEMIGYCRHVGDQGVAVVPEVLTTPEHQAWDTEGWTGLIAVIAELKGLGLDFADLGQGGTGQRTLPPLQPPPDAVEVMDSFLLRAMESGVTAHRSMLDGLVYTALVIGNASPITYDPDSAWRYSGRESPPPDALRRPVSLGEIARRIGVPRETVRRRMAHYLRLGWVTPARGGYLSVMAHQQRPEVLNSGEGIVQRFMQLLQALAPLGLDLDAIEGRPQQRSA